MLPRFRYFLPIISLLLKINYPRFQFAEHRSFCLAMEIMEIHSFSRHFYDSEWSNENLEAYHLRYEKIPHFLIVVTIYEVTISWLHIVGKSHLFSTHLKNYDLFIHFAECIYFRNFNDCSKKKGEKGIEYTEWVLNWIEQNNFKYDFLSSTGKEGYSSWTLLSHEGF